MGDFVYEQPVKVIMCPLLKLKQKKCSIVLLLCEERAVQCLILLVLLKSAL